MKDIAQPSEAISLNGGRFVNQATSKTGTAPTHSLALCESLSVKVAQLRVTPGRQSINAVSDRTGCFQ